MLAIIVNSIKKGVKNVDKEGKVEMTTLEQEIIEQIKSKYDDLTEIDLKIYNLTLEIAKLLVKKNRIYGKNNLLRLGIIGILLRLEDKLARIKNIIKKDQHDYLDYEAIEDALKDIAGYSINTLRLIREGKISLDLKKLIKEW